MILISGLRCGAATIAVSYLTLFPGHSSHTMANRVSQYHRVLSGLNVRRPRSSGMEY